METSELKKMLKGSTAVLILDNGEPSFVILGYDSYKNLLSDQEKEVKINHPSSDVDLAPAAPVSRLPVSTNGSFSAGADKSQPNSTQFQNHISKKEAELLEKINKEILFLKSEIEKEEKRAETKVDG